MRNRGFEYVKDADASARLPLRATKTSAGYDFYAVCDIEIAPMDKGVFATGVKAYMNPGEMLMMVVRSSAGTKLDLMVANTVGIIDSDYYGNPDNDGNIRITLRNLRPAMELTGYKSVTLADGTELDIPIIKDLKDANTVRIKAGERVVQGIFVPVLESDNRNSENEREGGIGSSGI